MGDDTGQPAGVGASSASSASSAPSKAGGAGGAGGAARAGGGLARWFGRHGALGPGLALAVLCVVLAVISPDFRKPENPLNILNQNAFVGLVAVGMTFVIIAGGIDLSVGSMVALLGGLSVYASNAAASSWGLGPWASVGVGSVVAVAGGAVAGSLNGALVVWGRVAPFIATLGTLAIFRSVIMTMADGGEIRSGVPAYAEVGAGTHGIPLPITSSRGSALFLTYPSVAFLVCAALGQAVLSYSVFGRRVLSVGDNATAARYAGVKVGRVTFAVYALAGLLCGVAAFLLSSRMASVASASAGKLYELDAIAAVVIGGTAMRGGRGSVAGTVVGVLMLGVITNALNLLGAPALLQDFFKGVIIIAAVLAQRAKA
ncbi:MAG: ABC transporter permease [Phycisphaeraceae bacterium]|nr:MAG: ABC transporter permease [Phycisphaeraceae bacterium]